MQQQQRAHDEQADSSSDDNLEMEEDDSSSPTSPTSASGRPTPDPLERFLEAQQTTYAGALAELVAGRKRNHWIWFILPQEPRPGVSEMSRFFGIANDDEGKAYLRHPVLGPRYLTVVSVIHTQICRNSVPARRLMGSSVDVLKLRSSLELFKRIADAEEPGQQELHTFLEQARELLDALSEEK